jgi:hypothetical protein
MKLRIKKNLLSKAWEEAVFYRKWQLEARDVGDFDSADKWQRYFEDVLEYLHKTVTDDYCTMHDMATIEAKALINESKEIQAYLEKYTQSLKEGA